MSAAEAGSLEVFLPEDIAFDQAKPIAAGGYGDLFKGHHSVKGTLALKRLRRGITQRSGTGAEKPVSFCPPLRPAHVEPLFRQPRNVYIAEARVWRKLHHLNVLSCLGILMSESDDLYLVSPWMDNGSLVDFVASHPGSDRTELVNTFILYALIPHN